jgi:hypothetical protein
MFPLQSPAILQAHSNNVVMATRSSWCRRTYQADTERVGARRCGSTACCICGPPHLTGLGADDHSPATNRAVHRATCLA